MVMHIPYEKNLGHRPDFKVKYRFITYEEGGRKTIPFQGIRSDFSYDGDDIFKDGIYAIFPEFIDENNDVISDNEPVPREGFAYMWIMNPEMRKKIHQQRIKVGVKGYF